MLGKFLSGLRADGRPLHAWKWRQLLGDELVDALVRDKILFDAGLATWFPCGGHCHRRRVVLDEGTPPDRPFVAPCAIDNGCEDARLSRDDLRMLAQDFTRLLEVLRERLGVERVGQSDVFVADGVVRLGQVRRDGAMTDVFIAIAPDGEVFPLFVANRAGAPRRTVVLVADDRALPDAALRSVGPTSHVDVAMLEDLLAVSDGKVVATRGELGSNTASAATQTAAAAVALLISHEGERELSAEEYEALSENAPDLFELFLDLATLRRVGRRKFYRGGTRSGTRYRATELTAGEAAGIADFIERARGAPVELDKLPGFENKAADQLFKTGWPKVDKQRRFVRTESGGLRFVPPAGARWALVVPIKR